MEPYTPQKEERVSNETLVQQHKSGRITTKQFEYLMTDPYAQEYGRDLILKWMLDARDVYEKIKDDIDTEERLTAFMDAISGLVPKLGASVPVSIGPTVKRALRAAPDSEGWGYAGGLPIIQPLAHLFNENKRIETYYDVFSEKKR